MTVRDDHAIDDEPGEAFEDVAAARRPHGEKIPFLQTWATLVWERFYGGLTLPVALLISIGALGLIGIWDIVPWFVHSALLFGGVTTATVLAIKFFQSTPPLTKKAVIQRIETDNALKRGLLKDLQDHPASTGGAGPADPLWRARTNRLAERVGPLRARGPKSVIDQVDPWGLRYGAILALIVGVLIADGNRLQTFGNAYRPSLPQPPIVPVDLWVDPPSYTGRAPTFLIRDGVPIATPDGLEVLTGSTLRLAGDAAAGSAPNITVQEADGSNLRLRLATVSDTASEADPSRVTLINNAAVTSRAGGSGQRWVISTLPDAPPSIAWTGPVALDGATRIALSLQTEDDFGIANAFLTLALRQPLSRPLDAVAPDQDLLTETLLIPLSGLEGPSGDHVLNVDLSDHPWAGLPVTIGVRVQDAAGQSAETEGAAFTLPIRTFYNPLAQAVMEERRSLSLSSDAAPRTKRLLAALTFAPEVVAPSRREYLLLRSAYHRLPDELARADEETLESFWALAVALEDEGLTLARQRLEAAQRALREALQRGAPPEEVDRLVEALREAMNDYLAALAASGDAMATGDESGQLEARTLDDILDEIAALRRQGDSAEARARLAELERLLENIRISEGQPGSDGEGQPGAGDGSEGDPTPSARDEALSETGDLLDQQRRLSDDTFAARRGERSADGLAQQQRGLAEAAEGLQEALPEDGAGNQGGNSQAADEADRALSEASDAMREAAQAIERGDLGRANSLQERALDALARGGSALSEALADGEGEEGAGEERGQRGTTGRTGGMSQPGGDRDPLGRAVGPTGPSGVEIPGFSDPGRIRELTDDLRRQLSDPNLPEAQREYIERLLERF